jgi:hypothetical protein
MCDFTCIFVPYFHTQKFEVILTYFTTQFLKLFAPVFTRLAPVFALIFTPIFTPIFAPIFAHLTPTFWSYSHLFSHLAPTFWSYSQHSQWCKSMMNLTQWIAHEVQLDPTFLTKVSLLRFLNLKKSSIFLFVRTLIATFKFVVLSPTKRSSKSPKWIHILAVLWYTTRISSLNQSTTF